MSMSELSKRIYQAICDAGLSYGELAILTKIPKSALQRYATGETEKCPLSRLEAIAKATGVSPAYLMDWDEEEASTADEDGTAAYISELTETLYRRPGMRILFDAAKDAPDDVLQKTADLLEALKNGQK